MRDDETIANEAEGAAELAAFDDVLGGQGTGKVSSIGVDLIKAMLRPNGSELCLSVKTAAPASPSESADEPELETWTWRDCMHRVVVVELPIFPVINVDDTTPED